MTEKKKHQTGKYLTSLEVIISDSKFVGGTVDSIPFQSISLQSDGRRWSQHERVLY